MNKSIVLGVLLAGVFSLPLMLAGPAFAQYMGSGGEGAQDGGHPSCLLYTSPSPRDQRGSRMPSSA